MSKTFLRKIVLGTLLTLLSPSLVFAQVPPEEPLLNQPTIYINEIYPDPLDDENEFVEFLIDNPSKFNFKQHFFIDNSSNFDFEVPENIEGSSQPFYYTIKLSRKLNNDGDIISLQKINDEGILETIQTVCYGNTDKIITAFQKEGKEILCEQTLPRPLRGKSLSYFQDTSVFEITSPTPEKENLHEEIKDEEPLPEIEESYKGLILSEVFPNPAGKDEKGINEWLEIYNGELKDVNLKGLLIQRIKKDSETNIVKIINTYEITEDIVLKSNEFHTLYLNFTLTNEICELQIVDKKQNVIDLISYNQKIGDDESVIKILNEIKVTTTPTPNAKNLFTPENNTVVETKEKTFETSNFFGLKIISLLPNPKEKDEKGINEWIEIQNTGKDHMNLKGLVLLQRTSRTYRFIYEEDTILKPNDKIKLYPDFFINNSSATIKIQNIGEEIFDTVYYDLKIKDDQVLARTDDNPELQIQKELGDILGIENSYPMPVEEVKQLKEETEVVIKGSVTVEPGVLGEDIFYIQDETGGIRVNSKEDSQPVTLGEVVVIEGETDTYHSEPEIDIFENSLERTNQAHLIQPTFIPIGSIDESFIGLLIQIEGRITKTSGNTFYVSDGSEEVKVLIKDSTGILRPDCRKGYYAKIIGILSVWDKTDEDFFNYRLLPRYQEDVFISKTLANTGNYNLIPMVVGFLFCFPYVKSICDRSSNLI